MALSLSVAHAGGREADVILEYQRIGDDRVETMGYL